MLHVTIAASLALFLPTRTAPARTLLDELVVRTSTSVRDDATWGEAVWTFLLSPGRPSIANECMTSLLGDGCRVRASGFLRRAAAVATPSGFLRRATGVTGARDAR